MLLVLGAGYIGAALAERALDRGDEVCLADNWYATRRDPASKAPFRAVMLIAVVDVVFLLATGLRV